jgi:NTP pyrophosphatase (non-canonical NTP hydrolase)
MDLIKKIELIASERDLSYCYLKVAEELFESGEICIKQVTKPQGSEERIPHLIEELGDVVLNILILSEKLDIGDKVQERVRYKLETLLNEK